MALPKQGKRDTLSQRYDRNHGALLLVPDYRHDTSLAEETAAAYAAEFPDGIPVVSDDPGGA